jgi:putative ABC transport system permease protein
VQVYFAESQIPFNVNSMQVAVRTTGDPKTYVSAIRAAIHEIDHDMPMSKVSTLDVMVDNSMGQRRLSTVLLGVFAGLALLLASIGIYGVMSYTVAQRTRELGVRVALGASRQSVLGLVMKQGVTITLIGVVIGLGGAFGLTRLIATQLFSVKATDPATFLTVTAVLVGVAVAATLVPALRATRIDPLTALREE